MAFEYNSLSDCSDVRMYPTYLRNKLLHQAEAIDFSLPHTPLCSGLYEEPIPFDDLIKPCNMTRMLEVVEGVLLITNGIDGILTPQQEMAVWKWLPGQWKIHIAKGKQERWKTVPLLPLDRPCMHRYRAAKRREQYTTASGRLPPVPRLTTFLTEFVADHNLPLKGVLSTAPALLRRVRDAQLDVLDRSRRYGGSNMCKPQLCGGAAPIPDVFSILSATHPGAFQVRPVPCRLWEDDQVRSFLIEQLGVARSVPGHVLSSCANAIREILRSNAMMKALWKVTGRLAAEPSVVDRYRYFSALSHSVVYLSKDLVPFESRLATTPSTEALAYRKCVEEAAAIEFVPRDPLPSYPLSYPDDLSPTGEPLRGTELSLAMFYAPNQLVSYSFVDCIWLVRAVMPAQLMDTPLGKMSVEPETVDVVAHLLKLIACRTMFTNELFGQSLHRCYAVLSDRCAAAPDPSKPTPQQQALSATTLATHPLDSLQRQAAAAAAAKKAEESNRATANAIELLQQMPVFSIPYASSLFPKSSDAYEFRITQHLCKLKQIIDVPTQLTVLSMEPFFYHYRNLGVKPMQELVKNLLGNRKELFTYPSVEAVESALRTCGNHLREEHMNMKTDDGLDEEDPFQLEPWQVRDDSKIFQVYVNLLQLYAATLEYHRKHMDKKRKRRSFHAAFRMLLPCTYNGPQDGPARKVYLCPASDVRTGSNRAMLGRVRPYCLLLVHSRVHKEVCTVLRVPFLGATLREVVTVAEPLIPSLRCRPSSDGHKGDLVAVDDEEEEEEDSRCRLLRQYESSVTLLLQSPLFQHLLSRLLYGAQSIRSTNTTSNNNNKGVISHYAAEAAAGGMEGDAEEQQATALSFVLPKFRVKFAKKIETIITNTVEMPNGGAVDSDDDHDVVIDNRTKAKPNNNAARDDGDEDDDDDENPSSLLSRSAHVNLARAGAVVCPDSALDERHHTIWLHLESFDERVFGAHYLIALQLNKLLRGRLSDLTALSCIVEMMPLMVQYGPSMRRAVRRKTAELTPQHVVSSSQPQQQGAVSCAEVFHRALDQFGCPDVVSTRSAVLHPPHSLSSTAVGAVSIKEGASATHHTHHTISSSSSAPSDVFRTLAQNWALRAVEWEGDDADAMKTAKGGSTRGGLSSSPQVRKNIPHHSTTTATQSLPSCRVLPPALVGPSLDNPHVTDAVLLKYAVSPLSWRKNEQHPTESDPDHQEEESYCRVPMAMWLGDSREVEEEEGEGRILHTSTKKMMMMATLEVGTGLWRWVPAKEGRRMVAQQQQQSLQQSRHVAASSSSTAAAGAAATEVSPWMEQNLWVAY